jgi:hypothetical protein
MRFIVDLFRTTQHEARLFEQPFAKPQLQQIDARYAAVLAEKPADTVTAA